MNKKQIEKIYNGTTDNQDSSYFSARSTVLIKAAANELGAMDFVKDVPYGNENYVFSIGQKVITTEKSQIKPGVELTIKDRLITDNGYVRYLAGGVYHRQQDLKVA